MDHAGVFTDRDRYAVGCKLAGIGAPFIVQRIPTTQDDMRRWQAIEIIVRRE